MIITEPLRLEYDLQFFAKEGPGGEKTEEPTSKKLEDARKMAEDLEKLTICVNIKAGENGKVFGSISAKEIAASAKAQHGVELDKKKIQLAEPIRSFGDFEVPIKLHPQVTGKLNVKVQGI